MASSAKGRDEILITELETEILSVFVKHKITGDEKIIGTLQTLLEKLQRAFAD